MSRLALPSVVIAALLALSAPSAASAATLRVVEATHTSSAVKAADGFRATSTATWKLARRGRIALHGATGIAVLPVKGTFTADATGPRGTCALVAPTHSTEYAAVAPSEATLLVGPDPRTGRGTVVSLAGPRATLGNPYFPSECSTSIAAEPAPEVTSSKRISRTLLRRRRITLRFTGSRIADGLTYRWSTKIVLAR